jgi:rare lipoprotein A
MRRRDEETRRMPMRQRIGLSLAMLMISTAALAGTPKKNGSEPSIQPPADRTAGRSRSARRVAHRRANPHAIRAWPARTHEAAQARVRSALYHPARLRTTGDSQIGEASWYRLEGDLTASGERMDDARLTAAHRWLPLLSYARVTNLQNGRSVIVQINDRGPVTHRFIIDLSPRAAEALGMLRAGVAAVEVQPVASDAPQAVQRVAAVE